MHDPQFAAAMAEIRGLDLGDDADLLARLDARLPQGLHGDDWLLRGVLMHRAGLHDDAVKCLEHAVAQGYARSRALYLESCMLRDADRLGDALEALARAREAADDDRLLTHGELEHAQALLDWHAGNLEDALASIERALGHDESSAARWLHRGQLLVQLQRPDEARRAFDRALLEEQDLDLAMYERAALEARSGDAEAAADWLAKASRLEPSHRRRATEDARFEPVRLHAALGDLLVRSRPAEQLAWLDAIAPWLAALRRDPDLAALGLEWLCEEDSDRIVPVLLAEHERGPLGTMHTQATLRRSRSLLATRRAVARGPVSRTRERGEEPCLLFVDAFRPQDGLWLSLSESYPPFLWIRVEPRPGSLRRALGEYFPPPRLRRVDMPARARGFLGYRSSFFVPSHVGGLEPATIVELDRHFSINPFVESAAWGSAYDDDPWPDEIPDQPDLVLKLAERQAVVVGQARGHVWSLTRRTRHSRSYLTLEVHQSGTEDDIYVAEVRYRPSAHASAVAAMNAHFGCDYPTDLPVDAVAALLGFQFAGAGDLQAECKDASDPEQLAGLLYVIAALRHDDLGVLELYRRYLDHPHAVVRSTIAELAAAYNYESLLEEMSLREPDPELRAEIEALLDEGIPVVEHDPFADDDDEHEPGDGGTLELDEGDLVIDGGDTVELDVIDVVVEDDAVAGHGRRGGVPR